MGEQNEVQDANITTELLKLQILDSCQVRRTRGTKIFLVEGVALLPLDGKTENTDREAPSSSDHLVWGLAWYLSCLFLIEHIPVPEK